MENGTGGTVLVAGMSGVLVLTKLNVAGQVVPTSIQASEIKGIEGDELHYNGKTIHGSKVYVAGGRYFKAFHEPLGLMAAHQVALTNPTKMIVVDSCAPNLVNTIKTQKALVTQSKKLLGKGGR